LAILLAVTLNLDVYACSAEIALLTEGIIGVLLLKDKIPSNIEIFKTGFGNIYRFIFYQKPCFARQFLLIRLVKTSKARF
jgi:hypothetical protein